MKKLILFCAVVAAFNESMFPQWTPVADYGGGMAYSLASFVINGRAFVGGGNPSMKSFYEYIPSTNSWEQRTDIDGNVNRASPIAFAISGKGYIGGGGDMGVGVTQTVYEYDAGIDSWTKKKDFPGGSKHSGLYLATSTKGYVIGGSNGSSIVDEVWEYDPASDNWTQKKAFPGGAVYWPAGFSMNEKLYVGTGSISGSSATAFYEFDPVGNSWTPKASFPGTARQAARGFAVGSKGYIGGGTNDSYTTSFMDFYEYDQKTDKWSAKTSLDFPVGSTVWSTAFVIGNNVYFGTGASISGSVTPSAKVYTTTLDNPTGISGPEINDRPEYVFWPNPADNILYLKSYKDAIRQATLFDAIGQIVLSEDPNETEFAMDISSIQSGIYYMVISTDMDTFTEKVLIE